MSGTNNGLGQDASMRTVGENTPKDAFTHIISDTRGSLENAAQLVKSLKTFPGMGIAVDGPETIANIQLSYRHLEDAKMRLGKALQAFKGERSPYDEAPLPQKSPV